MFPALLFLFIVIPLVEVMLLIKIGEVLGFWMALLVVIGTGALGAFLARLEGWRAWQEVQSATRRGEMPTEAILEAVLILIAGIVLITPGILTDIAGLLILFPLTRKAFLIWLKKKLKTHLEEGQSTRAKFEYRVKDDD